MNEELAFQMGIAFADGMRYAQSQGLLTEDKKNGWITVNGAHVFVRNGRPTGVMAQKIAPDKENVPTVRKSKLPSLNNWLKRHGPGEGDGRYGSLRAYVNEVVAPAIEKLRYPGGMPEDCERFHLSRRTNRSIVSHSLNKDKIKILPSLPRVLDEGTFRVTDDTKHSDIEKIVYTTAIVRSGGKKFRVVVTSKKRRAVQKGSSPYFVYEIGKADPVGDSAGNTAPYEIVNCTIEEI